MEYIYPDLEWYTGISEGKKVSPRCPYANVHRCPRYYASLYLLGQAGVMTKMNLEQVKKLDKYWNKTDLLPTVREHAPSVSGSNDKKTEFSNFCPEISFDVFGLFAIFLSRYADENDRDSAHSFLSKSAFPKDWRWNWSSVEPLHYLECQVYSQLLLQPLQPSSGNIVDAASGEIVEVKPSFMGISINVKRILTRLVRWWLSKQI